jgi:hypothetical protein
LAYALVPPTLAIVFLGLVVAPTARVAATSGGFALPLAAAMATAGFLLLSPFRDCLRYSFVILAARAKPHRATADRWSSGSR